MLLLAREYGDNTEDNCPRIDAEMNCLLALLGSRLDANLTVCSFARRHQHTDAYIVTTAMRSHRMVMSGQITPVLSLANNSMNSPSLRSDSRN